MLVIPNYSPANDLPIETKRHIAFHNDIPEKNKWMRVNKGWEAALKDERLWEEAGKKLSSFTLFKTIRASADAVNSLKSLDFFQRNLKLIPHDWRIAVDNKFKEKGQIFFEKPNKNTCKELVREYNESFIKDQILKQKPQEFYIVREVNYDEETNGIIEKFTFDGFRVRFSDQLTLEVGSLFRSNRVEDVNKLDKVNKAVDALLVWECLNQTIDGNTFHANLNSYNSIDELLEQSSLLKKWCIINQAELSNINTLDLSHLEEFEIHSLPEVIWKFLPNLQNLFANNLKLTSLPTSIGFCTKLHTIDLLNNCLVSLPENFSLLENLQYLSLAQNQFTTFPTCIFKLKKLQRFHIENNYLSSLPEDISKCKQLVDLEISSNYLSKLPDGIVKLKNLQDLSVKQNHLHSLPDNISELKELRVLNVSYNHLSELPNSILELQQLQLLDISNNDGNFTGVFLPDGYQSTNLADIEVVADKIPALTNPICTIQ